ncbi:protealysin inhibitor emfourin [Kineosporia succinea]|uniref:Uncharacterized protein n=1 Tax=Kineosporia succinea TaxID=84632 RepID=A0ABT9NVM1_9ACTN|nr:protealysin inhibitor emfourin [Kineosporia succinea]MDP9824472.1 hypothetical protein [Kineosporia succinea]
MLVTLRRSGGFAGLARPKMSVDTSTLPKGEAERVESAVREARVDEIVGRPAEPPRAGDRFVYELSVHDGSTRHTVKVAEPFADPALGALIELLSSYS